MNAPGCVIASIVLAAGMTVAQAQGVQRAAPLDMQRVATLLDLDEYQTEQVERVLAEQREERRVGSIEEMRAHFEAMRNARQEKLYTVLTEEQLMKFEVLMELLAASGGRMMVRAETHQAGP